MSSYSDDLSYPFEVLIEDFILGPYVAEAVQQALSLSSVATAKQLVEDYWRLRIRSSSPRNSEVLGLSLQEVCSQEARRLAGCAENLIYRRTSNAEAVSICEGMGQNILGQVLTVIQETQPNPLGSPMGRIAQSVIYRSRNILEGCRQLDEDLLNMLDQVVYEQSNREVYTDDIGEIHSSDDFFVDDPNGEDNEVEEDYY